MVASGFSRVSVAFCAAPPGASLYVTRSLSSASKLRNVSSRYGNSKFLRESRLSFNLVRPNQLGVNTFRISQAPFRSFSTSRTPSKQTVYAFDKVPTKLPDWWDDDDDEDTTDEFHALRFENGNPQVALGSGSGGFARNGGSGGSGRGEDGKFNGDGGKPNEGIFAALMAMYMRAMSRNPVLTKAITTSLIAFLGDVLAQKFSQMANKEFLWDMRRTLAITVWGFCFMGPTLHYWFSTLDKLYTNKYSVISKLITDQLLFAPFFNSAFMMGVGTLEGHSLKEVSDTVKTKLWSAMKANWMLWPAAQFINFSFVPKHLQVVYVNCVALVWNVIFMYISHSNDEAIA
ncbi:hypothetical protein FGB62_64g150 [Gracilaria domingensis]|nr:hypothetical protein FGB62_64g150 [Gracilaria domingensis]